ncbi:MAG: hypothetical protein methR_P1713 [Methyloprofundus sp.]|nr:MAG: hypothetical protein methR_P1713 [Methyloprofundus sp.]
MLLTFSENNNLFSENLKLANTAQAQMSRSGIDLDMLNDLFENQKKLDDAFNSMFDDDDDAFLSDLKVPEVKASNVRTRQRKQQARPLQIEGASQDSFFEKNSHSILRILIPVALEIALICYGIIYFF